MTDQSFAAARLLDLRSLSTFIAVRSDPVVSSLEALLEALSSGTSDTFKVAGAWADFARSLASRGSSLRVRLAALTAADENAFTLAAEVGGARGLPTASAAAAADLARLGRMARIDAAALAEWAAKLLREKGFAEAADNVKAEGIALATADVLAEKATSIGTFPVGDGFHPAAAVLIAADDWPAALASLAEAVRVAGAGKLGIHRSFVWNDRNAGSAESGGFVEAAALRRPSAARASDALVPVRHPDPIRLGDLSGYEAQRDIVIANTLRFLEGKSANNLLLYGDRGTGKSATVKAICNEYAGRALRLIEVRKTELKQFANILETLADRASRFVVFVDDLTFEKTDDAYTGLKALLEGGAEEKPDNVVVYATSNRRHLVKERLIDRPTTAAAALASETGDVRAFDSMQEQLSLADRFGVTVVFSSPSQEEYLRIAEFIAEQRGLLPKAAAGTEAETAAEARARFRADALRWERWFNGRSPRTARQYVDWIMGGEGFPWE